MSEFAHSIFNCSDFIFYLRLFEIIYYFALFIAKIVYKFFCFFINFRVFINKCAFITVFENFDTNVFSITDIVYFLSIIAAFVFLSVRSLEKRRWS